MSHHKMAVPEAYVLGSQPLFEDEVVKMPNGDIVKTGRKIHKIDIAQSLFTAADKPVGQRLLRQIPAWKLGQMVGTISHWINEAAKRRAGGDMAKARPEELVQVPVYRGVAARLANQARHSIQRKAKKQRNESIKQRIMAELEKRRQTAALSREGATANG